MQPTTNTSSRTDILKQMLAADPGNSFARYGLAMEYVKTNAFQEAVSEFASLLSHDPNYSAAYFHGGQTFEKMGDLDAARDMYRRGLAVTSDPHARGELQASLDILGE
ncbi:MAG: tetratricopeptide repeat protein [Acidobacteriota bacterium]